MKLLVENKTPIAETLITPENFAELLTYLLEGKISSRVAKDVLREMFSTGVDPSAIIEEKALWQISDTKLLGDTSEAIIHENPKAVRDYRAGKHGSLQFLVGRVMKRLRGANPDAVRKLLEEKMK